MLPSVGDDVQFTEEVFKADSSMTSLKDKKFTVLKLNMITITSSGQMFDVYISDGRTMHVENKINDKGMKVFGSSIVTVFEPWSGGYSSHKRKDSDNSDRCKKCSAMGELKGMACICPSCGHIIWGI